jgi:branched-chain amino acid transport system ATP-binding protein
VDVLRLEGVAAGYGDVLAVRSISLNVDPGECVALIGANGAGKTTTLRAIAGLLPLRGGRILFEGRPLAGLDPRQIVALGLAHVPEGRQIFASLTVLENLEMGARTAAARAARRDTLAEVFTLFPHLEERVPQVAGTLSGGEQQMLAIGRALMARPRLLLLDEPSLGLAPIAVRSIMEIVATVNRRGTTILLVEQNVRRALALCSRGYVVENGVIALDGSRDELLRSDHVRQAYLGI